MRALVGNAGQHIDGRRCAHAHQRLESGQAWTAEAVIDIVDDDVAGPLVIGPAGARRGE